MTSTGLQDFMGNLLLFGYQKSRSLFVTCPCPGLGQTRSDLPMPARQMTGTRSSGGEDSLPHFGGSAMYVWALPGIPFLLFFETADAERICTPHLVNRDVCIKHFEWWACPIFGVQFRASQASATNEKAAALCSLAPTRSDCCQLPRKKPTYVAKRKPNQSLAGCCYSHTSLHALAFQRLQVDNDLASTCAAFSGISSWFCNRTRSKCLGKAATGPFWSRGAGTGNQNQGQQVVRFVCSLF